MFFHALRESESDFSLFRSFDARDRVLACRPQRSLRPFRVRMSVRENRKKSEKSESETNLKPQFPTCPWAGKTSSVSQKFQLKVHFFNQSSIFTFFLQFFAKHHNKHLQSPQSHSTQSNNRSGTGSSGRPMYLLLRTLLCPPTLIAIPLPLLALLPVLPVATRSTQPLNLS